jgi:RNA polymerase sigma-70 factor (sigma-E family)
VDETADHSDTEVATLPLTRGWNQMTVGGVMRSVEARAGTTTGVDMAAPLLSFEAFYRASYAWAVSVAHLLTGDRGVAEELAQDAFERMHGRFDNLDNPGAFLRVCVLNAARSWHRRQAREVRSMRVLPRPEPTELAARELLDAVDRLPYRQRAVIVLRYYADLSEAQIAEALGCRPGTVKSLASRALAHLDREVER